MELDFSKILDLAIIGGENDLINTHLFGETKCLSLTRYFIKKAIERHGNNYDYNDTFYINMSSFVTIKCNKCFDVLNFIAHDHLTSIKGECPCQHYKYIDNHNNYQHIIDKIFNTYNDTFKCSSYLNNKCKKLTLECLECGYIITTTSPSYLLKKHYKCKNCFKIKSIKSTRNFITESKKIFGNIFDYSDLEDNIKLHKKITLICNLCGTKIHQLSKNHLDGMLPYHFTKITDYQHKNIKAKRYAKLACAKKK